MSPEDFFTQYNSFLIIEVSPTETGCKVIVDPSSMGCARETFTFNITVEEFETLKQEHIKLMAEKGANFLLKAFKKQ